ncbi:hypothetical protein PIROE2DRAFT_27691, partial [Piromyces sp. E2]
NTSMISLSKNSNYDNEFNFHFNYSFPIAMTPQFIEKYKNTPIIVEVWKKIIHLGNEQKLTNTKNNETLNENQKSINDKTNSNNLETKLMGLLRIPFQHIISSFIANKEMITSGNNFELKTPLILPEAEYPIMDPFTGISKGWVKSTLALGLWDQISKFKNNINLNNNDEKSDSDNSIKSFKLKEYTTNNIINNDDDKMLNN